MTEHSRIIDFASLRGPLVLLRSAGAIIAADDVGAGYAGLQMLLEMRPQIVKIDRALVPDIHRDPAKRAGVRMLGELSSRIDAWVESVVVVDANGRALGTVHPGRLLNALAELTRTPS